MNFYLKLIFELVPKLSRELSDSFLMRLTLCLKLYWFLFTRKTILRKKPLTFTFFYNQRSFSLPLISAIDVSVLVEIFVYKEYQWDLDFEVKNILDLGAHWGDSSLFYALQYPNASIYAVEPTPESFARLQTVAKTFPNIIPIQAALGMSRGKLPLYISKSTLGNSLTSRSDKDMQVIVDALSLKDFCERAGVAHFDVIKFDIEGAENVIFQDQSNIKLSKSFIGEIHYDLTNLTPEDIVEFFSSPNLDLIKLNEKRSILRFKNSLL